MLYFIFVPKCIFHFRFEMLYYSLFRKFIIPFRSEIRNSILYRNVLFCFRTKMLFPWSYIKCISMISSSGNIMDTRLFSSTIILSRKCFPFWILNALFNFDLNRFAIFGPNALFHVWSESVWFHFRIEMDPFSVRKLIHFRS